MEKIVAIVGAGYVGMQIAVQFAQAGFQVIAYDNDESRINALRDGIDQNCELGDFARLNILFIYEPEPLGRAHHFIVATPTPINAHNVPDLFPLKSVSKTIGQALKKNDVVVVESTVFPGATEQLMIPIMEKMSGLKSGRDFYVGYSPERVVPGDEGHSKGIQHVKVISAQNEIALEKVMTLYEQARLRTLHVAPSIIVAEACKLLENIQRDVNIALMNEYTQIMDSMNIPMQAVLKAAQTKWNFLPFKPGLVGGHFISVDPYYLTYQAHQYGVDSNLISTARQINERFVDFITRKAVRLLNRQGFNTFGAKVALLGISFKPNVPDTRHSLSLVLYEKLASYNAELYAVDPLANKKNLDLNWCELEVLPTCDAIVLIQDHDPFTQEGAIKIVEHLSKNGVLMDIPGVFSDQNLGRDDVLYWSI